MRNSWCLAWSWAWSERCRASQGGACQPIYALVDCRNFYVSAQRVSNPKLDRCPLVILSDNHGSVVAVSLEANALGIRMGTPWLQLPPLVRSHGLIGSSSNYTLCGDVRARVMHVLRGFTADGGVYAIDQSFLRIEHMRPPWPSLAAMGQASGFKSANGRAFRYARELARPKRWRSWLTTWPKNPQFRDVVDMLLCAGRYRVALLSPIDASGAWSVGRRTAAELAAMQLHAVEDLR